MNKPLMLLIMDGYGLAEPGKGNAIAAAHTPDLDKLFSEYPHSRLDASGEFVGLPEGQMGNSEVGHTNIGAGRVVWQDLSRISNAVKTGSFFENEKLAAAMDHAKETNKALHLMGLLSDGGVHSHITHLFALLEMAEKRGLKDVQVHAILDGRDVPPSCAEEYVNALEAKMNELGIGRIASISGRFYSMDRDKRWERLSLAYDLYTSGQGRAAENASALMKLARENGETDEFVVPGAVLTEDGKARTIEDGDSVIFFNFRPDRAREITRALVDPNFDGFERKRFPRDLFYVGFTVYDASCPNVVTAFEPQSLKNTLGEYLAACGRTQLRIAETEKYAHVTFFFNGGVEDPYDGEGRILVPSPKVATYDLQPEMSAFGVTEKAEAEIASGKYDLIILNLANCDMVGHTGVFDAAVKAVETVDACVGRLSDAVLAAGGELLITADHGNADEMLDAQGNIVTAHSCNQVPLIFVSERSSAAAGSGLKLKDGALCDIAPTLLTLMDLPVPPEMQGKCLLG